MSPPPGLTLFCGMCLAAFGWTAATDYISPNMLKDVKKMKDYFKPIDKQALYGKPLFYKDLDKFEECEQRLLLQEILAVYVSILSDMTQQTEDNDLKLSIQHVLGKIQDLRNGSIKGQMRTMKELLQSLWATKTEDTVVQHKAVRELMPVFQKASSLLKKRHTKKASQRKRRNTRRGGKRL